MEIYSTTLWHLQKDVALSALSKDLTDMDKNCPEVRALRRPRSPPSVLTLRSTLSSRDVLSRPRSSVNHLLSSGRVGSESFNLSACLSAGLVCSWELFQSAEGARYRHQVLPESHPGESASSVSHGQPCCCETGVLTSCDPSICRWTRASPTPTRCWVTSLF